MSLLDRLYQPLEVGDEVLYINYTRSSSHLSFGRVVGFTAEFVRVEHAEEDWRKGELTRISPEKIVRADRRES